MTARLIAEVVGAGAALCSVFSFVPQLVKLIREKAGDELSVRMYLLTVTAFFLWTIYGLLLASWPLIVSNVVSLALSSAILTLRLRYRGREPPAPAKAPR